MDKNSIAFLKELIGVRKMNINDLLKQKGIASNNDYSFLENDKETMDNLLYLCLGGSLSYGTEVYNENGTLKSDVDLRGIKIDKKDDIILNRKPSQDVNEETDTTIYELNKYIFLLAKMNPNTVEFCGSIDRNALFIHPYFKKMIMDNIKLFMSKQAFNSFAGYSNSQLSRLFNKLGRNEEKIQQQNILRSIDNASKHLKERYNIDVKEIFPVGKQDGLYILGRNDNTNFDLIFNNVTKENAQSFLNELACIFKDYNKLGKRNKSAIAGDKLGKHFMHLIRLTYMAYDLLVNQEIITYREKEHDLLMSIRNNENKEWLTDDNHITEKGENFINERMKVLENARDISKLPDRIDQNKIDNIIRQVNTDIITGAWR